MAKASGSKDAFTINPDGTIRLVVRGAAVELRVPTIGELKKLEGSRQQLLVDLTPVTERLREINEAQLAGIAEAAESGATPAQLSPELTAEVRELVQSQREAFGEFWATVIIPTLGDPAPDALVADDLPAFMGHGTTIGRAFTAWESSPPDPGVG